jgi:glucose-6-phosphate dehydrogenase assembly protein OpcA
VGETGPGETILLRMYGLLGQHADSVVAPLLAPDVPVVTWWPDDAPPAPAADPLGCVAQRRVTDAAASDEPREMLLTLAKAYKPGDTDLSWTRSTGWRTLLAAIMDQSPEMLSGEVLAEPANPTADLIAAWLGLRLDIEMRRGESNGPGITEVSFNTPDGKLAISRPDGRNATLAWPGRPERRVALHRRDTDDLIAEELRRLEPDEVYAETLRALAAGPAR